MVLPPTLADTKHVQSVWLIRHAKRALIGCCVGQHGNVKCDRQVSSFGGVIMQGYTYYEIYMHCCKTLCLFCLARVVDAANQTTWLF